VIDSSHAALSGVRSLAIQSSQLSAPADHAQAARITPRSAMKMNIETRAHAESQYSSDFGTPCGKKGRDFTDDRASQRSTITDYCIKKSSCLFFKRRKIAS
jgi:hypothetical protein